MAEPNPLDNVDPLVVLRLFEADVTHRRYQQAEECLLWLLQNASIFPLQQNKVFPPNYDEREVAYVATRLAAGLCQMFADPAFGIQDKDYHKWAMLHENMVAVLGVSGFGNSDHVIQNLLEPIESQKVEEVTRQAFNKILLLHDSDSDVKIPYEDYLPSHPKHILWMMILAVGKLFCVTEKENAARNKLIEMLIDKIDINAFDQSMLGWISIAWMHCSYATTPLRNKVKKTFNRMLVNWMSSIGIQQDQTVPPKERNGKPVLVVINEYFKTNHAMYRCFAPIIDALRSHFYLVGMTAKKHSDENAMLHFDEHHYLDWSDDIGFSLSGTVAKIRQIMPTAVYYPSVGMNISSILLSNLRFSNFQFISLGHPASSHSDTIDFCLVERQYVIASELFSEAIIAAVDGAMGFVPHKEQLARNEMLDPRQHLESGAPVRIAIPASAMKINAEFMETLHKIARRVRHPVEFHFFPNLTRLPSTLFLCRVRRLLTNTVVHPPMPYQDYMKTIARCQLHLSPFPFSSTNSLIDSLLLGLPLVVKQVRDTEVAVDAAIVQQAAIPSMVAQSDTDSYVEYACRLIDDHDLREAMSSQIRATDIEGRFYGSHHEAAKQTAGFVGRLVMRHQQGEQLNARIYSAADSVDAAVRTD